MPPWRHPRSPSHGRPRRASARHREDAVTEVIGSVLTVGITSALMMAVFVIFLKLPPPLVVYHADLEGSLGAGAAGWGSGDEVLMVTHVGGDPLPKDLVVVRYLAAGTYAEVTGDALGSAFADGALTIGETWSRTVTAAASSEVEVAVTAGSAVVWTGRVVAG